MKRHRGWLATLALLALLTLADPALAAESARPGRVANTDGENLRLRAAPSATAPIVKRLGPGWRLTVLGNPTADGRWLKVEHAGAIGYVAVGFVALEDHVVPMPPPRPRTGQVVNTDGANLRLRAAPAGNATILKRLPPETMVTILGQPAPGWLQIQHAGTTGYVSAAYIREGSVPSPAAPPAPPTLAPTAPAPAGARPVVTAAARVRSAPSTSATILRSVVPGQLLERTGKETTAEGLRWLSVRSGSREGWIVATAVGPVLAADTGQKLAAEAKTHVGRAYVWGGEAPQPGFDCSGLVRYVVRRVAGIDVTHFLPQQATIGDAVERDNLQVGDLVFFKNTYKPGLSHVGFYIGNGQFVNAQNEATGVVVGSLDVPYWRDRWVGARRLAN